MSGNMVPIKCLRRVGKVTHTFHRSFASVTSHPPCTGGGHNASCWYSQSHPSCESSDEVAQWDGEKGVHMCASRTEMEMSMRDGNYDRP
jgi:hypothetical protein